MGAGSGLDLVRSLLSCPHCSALGKAQTSSSDIPLWWCLDSLPPPTTAPSSSLCQFLITPLGVGEAGLWFSPRAWGQGALCIEARPFQNSSHFRPLPVLCWKPSFCPSRTAPHLSTPCSLLPGMRCSTPCSLAWKAAISGGLHWVGIGRRRRVRKGNLLPLLPPCRVIRACPSTHSEPLSGSPLHTATLFAGSPLSLTLRCCGPP